MLAFSDDGKLLAAGGSHGPRLIGQGGYVQLWEVETGQPMGVLERGTTGVTALVFARDRKHLIEAAGAGIDEEEIAFWNYRAGSGLEGFLPDRIGEVRVRLPFNTRPGHAKTRVDGLVLSLALSPDGSLLAAGGMVYDGFAGGGANAECKDKAGQIKVYESRTGKLIRTFPELPDVVLAVRFAADGKTLVAVSADKAEPVTRWDVATGRKLEGTRTVMSGSIVALSPDGQSLAFRERDGDVLIVPVSAGEAPPAK